MARLRSRNAPTWMVKSAGSEPPPPLPEKECRLGASSSPPGEGGRSAEGVRQTLAVTGPVTGQLGGDQCVVGGLPGVVSLKPAHGGLQQCRRLTMAVLADRHQPQGRLGARRGGGVRRPHSEVQPLPGLLKIAHVIGAQTRQVRRLIAVEPCLGLPLDPDGPLVGTPIAAGVVVGHCLAQQV